MDEEAGEELVLASEVGEALVAQLVEDGRLTRRPLRARSGKGMTAEQCAAEERNRTGAALRGAPSRAEATGRGEVGGQLASDVRRYSSTIAPHIGATSREHARRRYEPPGHQRTGAALSATHRASCMADWRP